MVDLISSLDLPTFIIGLISFYLFIPPGIPFVTPAGTFIDQVRSINFTIGVLVGIFLYLNDFTLLESAFVGTFWTSFLAYLVMV
jgi:hypothetical protein